MPDLSICVLTYNHEQFIAQAIKGILDQKTTYSFEIVVGEDFSTDNTTSICRKLAEEHPTIIRLLHTESRLGMMPNFIRTLNACKSRYVALCDGDDYWTDTNKLQKQVNFLEANPGYAICCHRIYIKENGKKPKLDSKDIYASSAEADYDIEMMAKYGNLIATPSVVYRNGLFSSFPLWFSEAPVGDYVVNMLNARYGKIKYLPEPMAVYRDHSKGAWGGKSIKENAAGMMKLIELLLTEPFDEPVKKGLKYQLQQNRAIYLDELMQENWDLFYTEFNTIMEEDKGIALALIGKIKADRDAYRISRTYSAVQKLKKIIKGKKG